MVCQNLTDQENTTLGGEKAQAMFEEVSYVIYGFLLPTVCAFGMVGNVLNLTILTRRKLQKSFRTLEQAANLCLISLAVSDLMFCVFAFPSMFLPKDDLYWTKGVLLTYRIYCTAIINVFIMISTWLTVAMSLERYLAICHPLRQDLYLTTRRIKIVILLTYVLSFLFNIPVLWRYQVQEICPRTSQDSGPAELPGRRREGLLSAGDGGDGGGGDSDESIGGSLAESVMDTLTTHLMTSSLGNNVSDVIITLLPGNNTTPTTTITTTTTTKAAQLLINPTATTTTTTTTTTATTRSTRSPATSPALTAGAPARARPLRYRPQQVSLWGSAQVDTVYRILWAVVNNVVPLLLLVYFNVCLCRKIYRSYKMRQKFKQGHHSRQAEHSSHVLTVTLVVIVLMFFILVAPSEVVIHAALLTNSNNSYTYMSVEAVMNFMQSLNFSVNFILYCIISPYFRKTLKYLFCCGCYNIYQVSKQWKKEFETSLM